MDKEANGERLLRTIALAFELFLSYMQQAALFTQDTLDKHTVQGNNMKAIFQEKEEGKYDVVLEINSHKFLISMKPGRTDLEEFEVIAIKGFVEYSRDVIQALKDIVSDVCYGKVHEAAY
ncbi:hypothetical protein KBC03_04970 [Patescibacteria group bacterium]|nr:hypothetical protein [Patescibacteria group bacterium]